MYALLTNKKRSERAPQLHLFPYCDGLENEYTSVLFTGTKSACQCFMLMVLMFEHDSIDELKRVYEWQLLLYHNGDVDAMLSDLKTSWEALNKRIDEQLH